MTTEIKVIYSNEQRKGASRWSNFYQTGLGPRSEICADTQRKGEIYILAPPGARARQLPPPQDRLVCVQKGGTDTYFRGL